MKPPAIISAAEGLRILENDLRQAARQKHAATLANATAAERQDIMKRIDRDVKGELRRHASRMQARYPLL